MPQIIINEWDGGIAPRYWQGNNLVKLGADNQYADSTANPLTYLGFISPANDSFTTLANADNTNLGDKDIITFLAIDDNNVDATGTSFYMGGGQKIGAIDLTGTGTVVVAAEFPHTINASAGTHSAHGAETVQDMVHYQINGSRRLLYFYTDNVDGDMGSYDLASSFTADDANEAVWSTATGGSVFDNGSNNVGAIIAEVADNGFLYVANANVIHKFDGTTAGGATGTVTPNVLDLEPTRKIIDMQDSRGFMWIATTDAATSGVEGSTQQRNVTVLIWNRSSTLSNIDDSIPIDGITRIHNLFIHRGIAHCFTTGYDDVVQLRRYNGSRFEVIKEIGIEGTVGKPANRHSILTIGEGILWLTDKGRIYYYGKIIREQQDSGLYHIGDLTSFSTGGALIRSDKDSLYVSWSNTGVTKLISAWTPFLATGVPNTGTFRTKWHQLPKLSRVTGVTFFWPVIGSGPDNNFQFDLYTNFSGARSNNETMQINHQDAPNGHGNIGYKYFPLGGKDFSNVNAIQIQWAWSTAGSISVAGSIRPSRIEIDYEPINKVK